jgi:type II secretory pathway component GspD/PulD (secretin)
MANARIRRVREEAVDDAVMQALGRNAEQYAPTLLQVARLTLRPRLTTMALLGILESSGSLRRRIERLLDFRAPAKNGLRLLPLVGVVGFAAVAVPMGQAPAEKPAAELSPVADSPERFPGQRVKLSQNRQAMVSALDRIRFELVEFEKLSLQEVVRYLNEETRRRDPNGKGVNFIINPGSSAAEARADQPAWGNISSLSITINPPLRDIRLADVLDAIVKVAETPLKYSIEDYAVVFSRKLNEPPLLYTRVFKLDLNTFVRGLESVMGKVIPTAEPERSQALFPAIREFFTSTGVDLSPPKTLYYKDREGSLLVRATLADLDAIEAAVQILNVAPPQVNLKTRFYAVPQGLALPGPTNAPGSNPSTFTAILTPAQASVILKSLNSASGVELLGEASITTLSGRQTQIQAVDLQTVATDMNPQAMSPPGVSTNALYLLTQVPVGPVLDVVAYVSADDHTVQLTATSTLTEFQGYDSETNHVRAYIGGKETSVSLPLPRFRTRQMPSSAVVWDGQTLVVGTVPAPRSGEAESKQLLTLITPLIIDAAGNRVHKEN